MAEETSTPTPKKEGLFQRIWGFVSEHGAIVLGAVAGLGVIYYLISSGGSSGSAANPSQISFPPISGGGSSGGTTDTGTTATAATPASTLSSWIAGISPSLLTDTASWQSLQSWLTGQSSTVTQGAASLYNQLVATYGAAPNISGLPTVGTTTTPSPIFPTLSQDAVNAWDNAYLSLPITSQTFANWLATAPATVTQNVDTQSLQGIFNYFNSQAGQLSVKQYGGPAGWWNAYFANPSTFPGLNLSANTLTGGVSVLNPQTSLNGSVQQAPIPAAATLSTTAPTAAINSLSTLGNIRK